MKNKTFIFLFLILLCFSLTSCSSFFGEEESLYVVSVEPNGDLTKMTITYSDGSTTTIDVPQGKDGLVGNGIKDIKVEESEDGTKQIVTIMFTDSNMDDVVYEVDNAVQITGVEDRLDTETNETIINLVFSDGSKGEDIRIPAGRGVERFDYFSDNTGTYIYFYYTDGTFSEGFVPTAKGEKGNGIKLITSSETSTHYVLIIEYDDGTISEVSFTRPTNPNTWLRLDRAPTAADGKSGDYCYDTWNNKFWSRVGDEWFEIFDFKTEITTATVIFDLNDKEDGGVAAEDLSKSIFTLEKGANFASSGYSVPVPERDGYEFVGWYTTKNPGVTNGAFTDMTSVSGALTLYAIWKQK